MTGSDAHPRDGTVVAVTRCALRAVPGAWDFSRRHAPAIAAHWAERAAKNPVLFDGAIHLLVAWNVTGGAFDGTFQRTDFKSFLYWRDQGYPDPRPRDCFGSALLRSREGHVLFGRQRSGNINGGLAYPPGGFIDPRDARDDGAIDIDGSIAREIREETGLDPAGAWRHPGYRVVFAGQLVAIAAEYTFDLPADALRRRILENLAGDPDPELTDVLVMRTAGDLEATTPVYARLLLRAVLA